MKIFKRLFLLLPLLILTGCATLKEQTFDNVKKETSEHVTYLVLTANGLYENKKGESIDSLFLENTIEYKAAPNEALPNKDQISSSIKDVEFTSWICYEGNGKPTIYDTVPSKSGMILYAFFTYIGDGGSVDPEPTPDIKTIYFEDAEWWNKDAAGTAIYLWNSKTEISNTWPGERMTHIKYDEVEKSNLWSFELDTNKYDSFIFVRVSPEGSVTDWGAKTIDLSVSSMGDNNLYSIKGSETIWGDPGVSGTWSLFE